jgi:hypothetical protein
MRWLALHGAGILWMFYANTGRREAGEKSAYSLFNDDIEA